MFWEWQHSGRNALGPDSSWRGSNNSSSASLCQSISKNREADLCQIWASTLPRFDFKLWVSVIILPHWQSWPTFVPVEFVQNQTLELFTEFPKVTVVAISTWDMWYMVTASLCLSMVVPIPFRVRRAAWVPGALKVLSTSFGQVLKITFVGFYLPFARGKCSLPSPY